ncbi:hypothetical protein V8J88_02000 [Massilia sp. W12]|uniref:hypothetical protein n=1 Tax=Massilia sp. W12 TaxID=3126507 RepID=UPI0030D5A273
MNKNKLSIFSFLIIGALLGGYVFTLFLQFESKRKSSVSAAARFEVSAYEMQSLIKKANNGDCNAAYRIGRHYSFFTVQFDDAIKWFRLAAQCPLVAPKEELISLLLYMENQPGVSDEIDKLLEEIREIDPNAALKSEAAVIFTRKEYQQKNKK